MQSLADDDSTVVRFLPGEKSSLSALALHPQLVNQLLTVHPSFAPYCMQSSVISYLLSSIARLQRRDIVLRSPTGSGKTLAYALPILHALAFRARHALRAVIMLPTHDLALQVAAIFRSLSQSVGLSVALATGATSRAAEATDMSRADIVIGTPGRLVDYAEGDLAIDLSRVEFLVLDESDRLLQESYQRWADVVIPQCGVASSSELSAAFGASALAIPATLTGAARGLLGGSARKILVSATQTRNPKRLAKLGLQRITYFEPEPSAVPNSNDVGEVLETEGVESKKEYSVPDTLRELGFVSPSARQKPLALLAVLGWGIAPGVSGSVALSASDSRKLPSPYGSKLIFTKSVESAHRLARLLELFARYEECRPLVFEISRDVSRSRRASVLAHLRRDASSESDQRPVIVVCSDVFARGMDMPSVDAVISYDAPIHVRMYLHRVGRTARAGRDGIAVTLVLPQQVRHFKAMVKDVDRGKKNCRIKDMVVDKTKDAHSTRVLSARLSALKRILRRESLGLISSGESLPAHCLPEMETHITTGADEESQSPKRRKTFDKARDEEISDRERAMKIEVDVHASEDSEDENMDSLDGGSDDEEDTFAELIQAHVARSWLTA